MNFELCTLHLESCTMTASTDTLRALGLCSGGLDSILAALVLKKQGLAVTWISFETPFFSAAKARRAAQQTGIPLIVEDITDPYLEMLKAPPCGYGQHLNPCMDCHALMFRLAGRYLATGEYHFLFSGEVLGQRPMSQTRPSLRYVEKHSGCDGYILRPLSALRLPETIPEKEGWVQREQLLGLAGRSRKPQIEMAREWGIRDYPAPAGGCLLTDAGYARRLQDVLDHLPTLIPRHLYMLKYGRHLRLNPALWALVGRTREDNQGLREHYDRQNDILMHLQHFPGPTLLVPGPLPPETLTPQHLNQLAAVCAGYSKAPDNTLVPVKVHGPNWRQELEVNKTKPDVLKTFLI